MFPQPRERIEIGGEQRVEQSLPPQQVRDRLRAEQEAQISLAPEAVPSQEARRSALERRSRDAVRLARLPLRRGYAQIGRAELRLRRSQRASFHVHVALGGRELPEEGRLAARELPGPFPFFGDARRTFALCRRREDGGGVLLGLVGLRDREKEDERDHARRNRATAR